MSYSAIENTPISVDIVNQASIDTGWTINGLSATHSSCNAGNLRMTGFAIVIGQTYEVAYKVDSISGGYVQLVFGGAAGSSITTSGFVIASFTATNTTAYFYSNANCTIELLNIQVVQTQPISNTQQNSISFSQKTNKWVSFYTFVPDIGGALNTKVYTANQGQIYVHESGADDRNNFYGTQYQSILQFVDAPNPTIPKQFQSISVQSNELMITTSEGIQTSLGQISELSQVDFIKDYLSDGVSSVNVQDVEGIYSANLLRDANSPDGLLNGDVLRGNYIIVSMISTSNVPLLLYTINVVSKHSPIGAR
jgi:hypothetical protein